MPIMFNTILREAGISPKDVRLIRHKDSRAKKGYTPYELWRDDRAYFEKYQSIQDFHNRPKINAPYWAVFIVNFSKEVMFAGLYSVKNRKVLDHDIPSVHLDEIYKARSRDLYELELQDSLSEFIGKLFIDWGQGALAWIQYASRNNKQIVKLLEEFREPEFPGYLNFIQPLSKLDNMPQNWISALSSSRGIYLLTCPRTREQYIGSATGENGFWGRWQDYISTGHGGNIALKSREPSDYQVSILEVCGTSESEKDILKKEILWKNKLQSREMGLNAN